MSRKLEPPPGASASAGDDPPDEARLWQKLREDDADGRARMALFERYRPLVRRLAAHQYSRRVDDLAGFDDYMQLGSEGLLEALSSFDPARGASFETFASYRIRGAIKNGVRVSSERNELASFRARRQRDRVRSLAERGADESGPRDEFREMVDLTIDLALGFLLEDNEAQGTQSGQSDSDPYACEAIAELRDITVGLLDTLPEREAQILRYHYFQQMPFQAIAQLMGVSKGRVSQLHHKALWRLRQACGPERKLDSYL